MMLVLRKMKIWFGYTTVYSHRRPQNLPPPFHHRFHLHNLRCLLDRLDHLDHLKLNKSKHFVKSFGQRKSFTPIFF